MSSPEPMSMDETPKLGLSSRRGPSYGELNTLGSRSLSRRFASSQSLSRNPSTSMTPTSRVSSTAFVNTLEDQPGEHDWEVVRWRKLDKIAVQAFSEPAKRNFGRPTCMAISSCIALGTSRGLSLVFDSHQKLTCIIGQGGGAGAVTAIALSADQSSLAAGHASGNILTWELAKPSKPFLHIPPRTEPHDGHLLGAAVLHISFLGVRHTALTSADDKGMAFSHLATRGLGAIARNVKTTRILGKYPEQNARKPSSVLAFAALPLRSEEHVTDSMGLVAIMTPYLLVVVSTMPVAETYFKLARPKSVASHSALAGALAWSPRGVRLIYCWSNLLTVLEMDVLDTEPLSLDFLPQSQWTCPECIAAVQWLRPNLIAVLTITQQLAIVEDGSMRILHNMDLVQKHIYHANLFDQQLRSLVDHLEDEELAMMHGVVADAFYMSIRVYKGRLFLLGNNEISLGTLSNWEDRIEALVEKSQYIEAIDLATNLLLGSTDALVMGLPGNDQDRRVILDDRLIDLMQMAQDFVFNRLKSCHAYRDLAVSCVNTCIRTDKLDFLFDACYPMFEAHDQGGLLLEQIAGSVESGTIRELPPPVVQDLVLQYTGPRAEQILIHLDPSTIDLDQVTKLCHRYHLFEALFYLWTESTNDYVSILDDLLGQSEKVFPFLAYTWTGRIFPTGQVMSQERAELAKAALYHLFFSGVGSDRGFDPLHRVLAQDASSFLAVLNEAFEDSFLNDNSLEAGSSEIHKFGSSVNRQWIIEVLLQVVSFEDYIHLCIFVAQNVAKFPQFILLPGHTLTEIVAKLCRNSDESLREECQLSVEYLLTTHRPPDISTLMSLLREARFYRILKRLYRGQKRYVEWLEMCFLDKNEPADLFSCIGVCLQNTNVSTVIKAHAQDLLDIDIAQTACTLQIAPDLHPFMLETMDSDQQQYQYLGAIPDSAKGALLAQYIRLKARIEPQSLREYLEDLDLQHLRLEEVLPTFEEQGLVDAEAVILTRAGRVQDALARLLRHVQCLGAALESSRDRPPGPDIEISNSVCHLLGVGIWICRHHTQDQLWVDLLSSAVRITTTSGNPPLPKLRSCVQDIFTALLLATSKRRCSFLHILIAFLDRAAQFAASLDNLRFILAAIFTAYAYETRLLSLSHGLIDQTHFLHVRELERKRRQGWRPRGSVCEHCRGRIWGTGAGDHVWEAWQKTRETTSKTHDLAWSSLDDKGKGRAMNHDEESPYETKEPTDGSVVIFACRHLYHRTCLMGGQVVCGVCLPDD